MATKTRSFISVKRRLRDSIRFSFISVFNEGTKLCLFARSLFILSLIININECHA